MDQQELPNQKQKLAQQSLSNISVPDFLLKTYQMLEDGKHSAYISWNKDGTMIIIKKPLQFAEEVLPVFFKHSNLSSFIRQLNNYSFRKMKSKDYEYCFYHEMFRKDRKDLLRYIKRKKSTRSKSQKATGKNSNASKKAQAAYSSTYSEPIDQNKKAHPEESTSAKALQESQILYLKRSNQRLKEDLMKLQNEDQSLRNVIGVLTNYYGAENVQNILKMAESQKTDFANGQGNEANKAANFQFFEQFPNQSNMAPSNQVPLHQEGQGQEYIDFDPFHNILQNGNGFNFANSMAAEGMETADNYSTSPPPHLQGEQSNNFKYGLNQVPGEGNLKQEADFFREDPDVSGFPYNNMPNSY